MSLNRQAHQLILSYYVFMPGEKPSYHLNTTQRVSLVPYAADANLARADRDRVADGGTRKYDPASLLVADTRAVIVDATTGRIVTAPDSNTTHADLYRETFKFTDPSKVGTNGFIEGELGTVNRPSKKTQPGEKILFLRDESHPLEPEKVRELEDIFDAQGIPASEVKIH